MKIAAVKLNLGGIKGMEITYDDVNATDDGNFLVGRTEKNGKPVPKEIKDKIKSLGFYLLDICGYNLTDAKRIMSDEECTVTGYSCKGDGFVLKGKMTTNQCVNSKEFALNTPFIREVDQYEKYDDVSLLILEINKMTKDYVAGKYSVDLVQTAMDFSENPKVGKNDFDITGMSSTDALAAATEYLESKGCLVMQPDDMVSENAPKIEEEKIAGPVKEKSRMAKVA